MSFKLIFLLAKTSLNLGCEGRLARATGASSRENVGMSNEKEVRTLLAESLRVPPLCQSSEG